ncbi:phage tail protein [Solirubrobacter phytolaccae]|uniref:Phage tail protein n=1 Tax=Solirubrobacter phytolaccae TaxID=1404360 RepID=A0A9X3SIB6_9ACTN|nr:phage tail protein [Solirubrobacter phytolaccae]MDA0184127.1 phage tail protein [Solirubrobacter phytolaccae]
MTAGARFYARLAPLEGDDGDGTLENLSVAFMHPVEIAEISRDQGELIAWEALWDPDTCPEDLLDWLAIANGIVLPPSAITPADKRYRIKQAAGRYRGTPRALVEEVQLELTGTKTVIMAFQSPDRWSYAVGTIDAETSDTAAIDAAIERQNPAFTLWSRALTSEWSYLVLGPTLIATRVGDEYTIGTPTYPDYASIVAAFSDYQHLEDNDPDL